MKQSLHLQKRYRAERRFQMYGKCAIGFALISLALLLTTIVERGWQGFLSGEIRLTLTLDEAALGHNEKEWRHADAAPILKTALLARFPVTDHRETRELVGMLSSGAAFTVRNAVIADPKQLGKKVTLWLTASDAVDRFMKSPKNAPLQKMTASQRDWFVALKKEGSVRMGFNHYFFSAGDSREPELAGFMGSIVGSLFTLLACMLAALPVGIMAAIYLEEFSAKSRVTEWIEISNVHFVPWQPGDPVPCA